MTHCAKCFKPLSQYNVNMGDIYCGKCWKFSCTFGHLATELKPEPRSQMRHGRDSITERLKAGFGGMKE